MMFKTTEDVAKEFRRRYGHDPAPAAWDQAVEWKWINDVVNEPDELDSVLDRVRKLEALGQWPRGGPREQQKELPPDQRAIALARILAGEAARNPLVESFRAECLRGQLLEPSRIKSWIEEREREQGEPARHVKRWERTDGEQVKPPNRRLYGLETWMEFGEVSSGVFLQYPGGSAQVSADSELGRLKFTATALHHRFLWPEAEAVGFILSGTVPSPFFGSVRIRNVPSTARITIEVDPRVPAQEVLRLYQWARESEPINPRSLSELHAELAVFAFERNDGREWSHVLAEWNETHDDHSYGELSNFIRDCRKAYERVTGNSLEWKRKRGGAGHRAQRRPRRQRGRRG